MSKAHRLWNTPAEVTHPATISRPPEFVFFDDFISALAFSSSHAFFLSVTAIYTHQRNYFSAIYRCGAIAIGAFVISKLH